MHLKILSHDNIFLSVYLRGHSRLLYILLPLGFCSLCLCVWSISLATPLSAWGFLFLHLYNVAFLRIPYLFTIMPLATHILSWCNQRYNHNILFCFPPKKPKSSISYIPCPTLTIKVYTCICMYMYILTYTFIILKYIKILYV